MLRGGSHKSRDLCDEALPIETTTCEMKLCPTRNGFFCENEWVCPTRNNIFCQNEWGKFSLLALEIVPKVKLSEEFEE